MTLLKFGFGNSKLQRGQVIFDLPAGHTCPFALNCFSKADRKTGKIQDGEETEFRCYAASLENMRPNVRNAHWHNYDLLKGKTAAQMVSLIEKSLPLALVYRIHSSGDFFKLSYLMRGSPSPASIHNAFSTPILRHCRFGLCGKTQSRLTSN